MFRPGMTFRPLDKQALTNSQGWHYDLTRIFHSFAVFLTTRGTRARHQDVDHNRDDNRDAAHEGEPLKLTVLNDKYHLGSSWTLQSRHQPVYKN